MHQSSKFLGLLLLPTALANFHIGVANKRTVPIKEGNPPVTWTTTIACPSNYLNCKCYGQFGDNADRGVGTVGHKQPGDMFSLQAGLCGMGQLDFYYRSDRRVWEFYVHNGDGSLQGTCYSNSGSDWCVQHATTLATDYSDKMWCDSYICGK